MRIIVEAVQKPLADPARFATSSSGSRGFQVPSLRSIEQRCANLRQLLDSGLPQSAHVLGAVLGPIRLDPVTPVAGRRYYRARTTFDTLKLLEDPNPDGVRIQVRLPFGGGRATIAFAPWRCWSTPSPSGKSASRPCTSGSPREPRGCAASDIRRVSSLTVPGLPTRRLSRRFGGFDRRRLVRSCAVAWARPVPARAGALRPGSDYAG